LLIENKLYLQFDLRVALCSVKQEGGFVAVCIETGTWASDGKKEPLAPLEFENFSKNLVFVVSSGKKTNFSIFGPHLEKRWKIPWWPPLKKLFRRL